MNIRILQGRGRLAVGAAVALAMVATPVVASSALAAPLPPSGTVVTTAATSFGRALVVGSGPYAGFSLYFITSDHGSNFGCTSTPVSTVVGTLLCAGPPGDTSAEWPAMTTMGEPVAEGGVTQSMLGKVYRSGIGWQITYAGHPLYLFDQGPYEVTGEGWDEPGLPPWHGVWDLIQPSGKALAWPGTLTVLDLHGQWVLATPMFTAVGWEDFPLYTYSKDSGSASACSGACAIAWPRMLTSSMPAVDGALNPNWVGTLRTGQGWQVSYHGRPLYLFGNETIVLSPTGKFLATGSGQGITLNGGTFSLATP